jgi:hypothetical protein
MRGIFSSCGQAVGPPEDIRDLMNPLFPAGTKKKNNPTGNGCSIPRPNARRSLSSQFLCGDTTQNFFSFSIYLSIVLADQGRHCAVHDRVISHLAMSAYGEPYLPAMGLLEQATSWWITKWCRLHVRHVT